MLTCSASWHSKKSYCAQPFSDLLCVLTCSSSCHFRSCFTSYIQSNLILCAVIRLAYCSLLSLLLYPICSLVSHFVYWYDNVRACYYYCILYISSIYLYSLQPRQAAWLSRLRQHAHNWGGGYVSSGCDPREPGVCFWYLLLPVLLLLLLRLLRRRLPLPFYVWSHFVLV